jgi:hypothetical protein
MDFKRIVLYGTLTAHAGMASAARELSVIALFRDKALVEIDGQQRLLIPGTGSPEGIRLVSADSNEAVIEIDGRRQTYHLGQHIASRFTAKAQATVRIWPDPAGMYAAPGSINGVPVQVLIDTGATQVAMNKNEARRLGIERTHRHRGGRPHGIGDHALLPDHAPGGSGRRHRARRGPCLHRRRRLPQAITPRKLLPEPRRNAPRRRHDGVAQEVADVGA